MRETVSLLCTTFNVIEARLGLDMAIFVSGSSVEAKDLHLVDCAPNKEMTFALLSFYSRFHRVKTIKAHTDELISTVDG